MSKIFKALERAEVERGAGTPGPLRPPHVLHPDHELDVPEPSEEFDRLKVMLTLAASRAESRSVMLVSALPGEGVSTVVLGLAMAMVDGAQQGVLLVDCNSARPDLTDRLGLPPGAGLSELLAKEVSRADAIRACQVTRLFVLGRGRMTGDLSQPASLALFEELVTGLKTAFDYVIFDGGSLDACPDSLLLAGRVDGVVLVVRAERTGTEALREASAHLKKAGANLLGAVLNRRREYLPRFLTRK